MSASISTHVLDTARGAPASGVRVELAREREVVASAETDGDGRIAELARDLEPGRYELVFWPPSPFFTRVELEVELGREATKEELAEATGLPIQHVDEALGAAHASVSLNQTVGADDEGELGDLFADREAADPFDEAEESLRRQSIRRALDALPERERRILELRFGFEGEPWTLEAIGHELDLTRERVRQLEGQALKRLEALRDLAGLAA